MGASELEGHEDKIQAQLVYNNPNARPLRPKYMRTNQINELPVEGRQETVMLIPGFVMSTPAIRRLFGRIPPRIVLAGVSMERIEERI